MASSAQSFVSLLHNLKCPSPGCCCSGYLEGPQPRYAIDEGGNLLYEYDPDYINAKYEIFDLKVIHRR